VTIGKTRNNMGRRIGLKSNDGEEFFRNGILFTEYIRI
jgi:hypothetical protein